MIATLFGDFRFEQRWHRRLVLAAMVWFVSCLLYTAPAALFAKLLRAALPALQLQNVSGSFWNGAATQAFWQQNNQSVALGSIEWHLQSWSLLWLHPSARVVANYGEQFIDARIRISPLGSVTVSDSSAAVPAAILSHWLPVAARGQLALKLDRAELTRSQWRELRGALVWQQAQWQWNSRWLSLGDYRCELRMPAAQKMQCAAQGQGALAIDGNIDVDSAQRNWAAQLQIRIDGSLPDDFRQSLQVMLAAQPDAEGKLQVRRSGRW